MITKKLKGILLLFLAVLLSSGCNKTENGDEAESLTEIPVTASSAAAEETVTEASPQRTIEIIVAKPRFRHFGRDDDKVAVRVRFRVRR